MKMPTEGLRSRSFAGIRPAAVPGFIGAQVAGAVVGAPLLAAFTERTARP
jgi:hypothetical protein